MSTDLVLTPMVRLPWFGSATCVDTKHFEGAGENTVHILSYGNLLMTSFALNAKRKNKSSCHGSFGNFPIHLPFKKAKTPSGTFRMEIRL